MKTGSTGSTGDEGVGREGGGGLLAACLGDVWGVEKGGGGVTGGGGERGENWVGGEGCYRDPEKTNWARGVDGEGEL